MNRDNSSRSSKHGIAVVLFSRSHEQHSFSTCDNKHPGDAHLNPCWSSIVGRAALGLIGSSGDTIKLLVPRWPCRDKKTRALIANQFVVVWFAQDHRRGRQRETSNRAYLCIMWLCLKNCGAWQSFRESPEHKIGVGGEAMLCGHYSLTLYLT